MSSLENSLSDVASHRVANIISNIFNPFVMATACLLLLAQKSGLATWDSLRLSFVIACISVLPVILSVLLLVKMGKLESISGSIRQQRTGIYALAVTITTFDYLALRLMHSPSIYIAAMGTGLLGLIVFMIFNFRSKLSLHTAFIASFVVVLVICYGWLAFLSGFLVIVTGWARVALKEHTIGQVVAGAVLSAGIGILGFSLWGFVV